MLQSNLITTEQLQKAKETAEKEKRNFEDVLVRRKIIDIEDLARIKAKLNDLPYENLSGKKIPEKVLNIISSEVSENYQIICFEKKEKTIKIGLVDPDNFKAIEAVDFLAKGKGFYVEYYLISKSSLKSVSKQYKTLDKELSKALEKRAEEEGQVSVKKQGEESLEIEDINKTAPVAKIVSVIIRHAVEGGASDIHIEPLRKESRVRYRIDGILHTTLVLPRNVHASIIARIKVMSNLKLDETRIPQDGRIRLLINEKEIDFRVSILPLIGTEKAVLRILDTTQGAPKLEELGFQGGHLKIIKNGIKATEGMILVTGPTGSGKSTTLFALLEMLNKEGVNISTIEDPVEYQLKGVNQSQIKPEIGYTFASGLRSFLRQDPDIIMVGEVRDEETAELSIHAALTGHLVLSTVHTNNTWGTITRMVDMGVEHFLLGSTLKTIIAQRLARNICENCKEAYEIPEEYYKEIKESLEKIDEKYIKDEIPDYNIEKIKFHRGKGCSRCGNTGYSGRIAIVEVLDVNEKLAQMIVNGKKTITVEDIRSTQKFITMKQDGIIKVIQGKTSMEEVLRVTKT